jgi:hypothetical protein
MKAILQPALVDSLPEAHPHAHDYRDDFTYDPVIVKVYRWLEGMEDALSRRRDEANEEESEFQA